MGSSKKTATISELLARNADFEKLPSSIKLRFNFEVDSPVNLTDKKVVSHWDRTDEEQVQYEIECHKIHDDHDLEELIRSWQQTIYVIFEYIDDIVQATQTMKYFGSEENAGRIISTSLLDRECLKTWDYCSQQIHRMETQIEIVDFIDAIYGCFEIAEKSLFQRPIVCRSFTRPFPLACLAGIEIAEQIRRKFDECRLETHTTSLLAFCIALADKKPDLSYIWRPTLRQETIAIEHGLRLRLDEDDSTLSENYALKRPPLPYTPIMKSIHDALSGGNAKIQDELIEICGRPNRTYFRIDLNKMMDYGIVKNDPRVGGYYLTQDPPSHRKTI